MFLDEAGVAILFRLINFSVFVFFILYLCKKYLIDTVKKQIADKQQAMVDLHNQADTLVDDMRLVEQAMQQDTQLCQALKTRVVTWRARDEHLAQQSILKKQEQAEFLKDHVQVQTMYLQRRNAYERMLPQVIDQTREKLERKFEDEVLAQEFIAQLINAMQKGG